MSNALSALKKLKDNVSLNVTEVYCNVINQSALAYPLTTKDDVNLRTMITSVDLYQKELNRILYKNIQFPSLNGKKMTFNDFCNSVSLFDRKILIWGILRASYKSMGKYETTCSKCNEKWERQIQYDELLNVDTLAEKFSKDDMGYKDYLFPIDLLLNDNLRLVLYTKIPSIKDFLDILEYVDTDSIKKNYDIKKDIFSSQEDMTLKTEKIDVISIDENGVELVETIDNKKDIFIAYSDYIKLEKIEEIIDKYNEEFSKYMPEFKVKHSCPNCGHEFDTNYNIEQSLLINFLTSVTKKQIV